MQSRIMYRIERRRPDGTTSSQFNASTPWRAIGFILRDYFGW